MGAGSPRKGGPAPPALTWAYCWFIRVYVADLVIY